MVIWVKKKRQFLTVLFVLEILNDQREKAFYHSLGSTVEYTGFFYSKLRIEFRSLNLLARTDSESAKNKLVARVLYSLLSASENPLKRL